MNSVVVSRHVREVFFHHGGPRFNPGFAPTFSFASEPIAIEKHQQQGAVYQRLDSVIANHNVTGSNPV